MANQHKKIEALIASVAIGDRKAFDELYHATSAKLFGICLRVLNDHAAAEDALQDVFVRIWHKADSYAVNGYSPMTWLITIARNLSIDRLRAKRAPSKDVDEMVDLRDSSPGPESAAIASSEAARIKACMDELEESRSEAVKGAYLSGMTYEELAQKFDVPINTMRTWLRRSLLKLRDCLGR